MVIPKKQLRNTLVFIRFFLEIAAISRNCTNLFGFHIRPDIKRSDYFQKYDCAFVIFLSFLFTGPGFLKSFFIIFVIKNVLIFFLFRDTIPKDAYIGFRLLTHKNMRR